MNKQSSVEWLFHQMIALCEDYDDGKINYTDYINGAKEVKEQAKEMHNNEVIEALSLAKELNKQQMTFVPDEISDNVLFEQATVAMEEIYGSGCREEIDAYFRGLKWMQKQYNK